MRSVLFAFGSIPKDGGTFTFYRNMRKSLLAHGIDLRCVTVGKREAALWDDSFADDGCVLLAENESSIKKQAQAFCQWCEQSDVDIVMGVNSVAILSALPHLPHNIRFMSRCANAFDHGYKITVSCYERLSRVIALAPRQIDDLVNNYGADKEKIALIPNGTKVDRFEAASNLTRGKSKSIRLGFLGRLEHTQKGVLYLPEILHRLKESHIDFSLSIAGKGVHEASLRQQLATHVSSGEVVFLGALGPEEIAGYLANIDVYVFPSHFEGSPNALIEAIMAGCVPAAWQLDGITDFLINDGVTGLIEKTGECHLLADRIASLAIDRDLLKTMSRQVSAEAKKRFNLDRVVNDYLRVIDKVMDEPTIKYQVKPWDQFQIEPAFYEPYWRKFIPVWFKRALKKIFFKLGLVDRFE